MKKEEKISLLARLLLSKQLGIYQRDIAKRGGKRVRAKKRVNIGLYYWQKRIIGEMKQNAQVQEKIISGKFDRFLGNSAEA